MFTGIISGLANIVMVCHKEKFSTITVHFPTNLLYNLKIGDSVANNGCCLTVTRIKNDFVDFDIMQETLKITNLGLLKENDKINIERSLKFGDEIGGHLVSGHILGIAKILDIIDKYQNKKIFFQVCDASIMKYIFLKGFISIDGISLTIGNIYKNKFFVSFIPETIFSTNISFRKIGDIVNIEVDYYTKVFFDYMDRIRIHER
ncbi:riboflavin synthase subunit alpha [Buchnera aphidicola]|uniref:riboflavin synthase subunit alpha n=1 Tax=Buchnera aphidicola TaxID=9 RepID=UPI0031B88A71